MKLKRTGNPPQDDCIHIFEPISINSPKTRLGFYKDALDFKKGEMYNIYMCTKCSRIVTVDFNEKDESPVKEFENEFEVAKTRIR